MLFNIIHVIYSLSISVFFVAIWQQTHLFTILQKRIISKLVLMMTFLSYLSPNNIYFFLYEFLPKYEAISRL